MVSSDAPLYGSFMNHDQSQRRWPRAHKQVEVPSNPSCGHCRTAPHQGSTHPCMIFVTGPPAAQFTFPFPLRGFPRDQSSEHTSSCPHKSWSMQHQQETRVPGTSVETYLSARAELSSFPHLTSFSRPSFRAYSISVPSISISEVPSDPRNFAAEEAAASHLPLAL